MIKIHCQYKNKVSVRKDINQISTILKRQIGKGIGRTLVMPRMSNFQIPRILTIGHNKYLLLCC